MALVSRLCLTQQLLCILGGSFAYPPTAAPAVGSWSAYSGGGDDRAAAGSSSGQAEASINTLQQQQQQQIRHDHRMLLQRAIDRRWSPPPPVPLPARQERHLSPRIYGRPTRPAATLTRSRTSYRGQARSKVPPHTRLRRRETSAAVSGAEPRGLSGQKHPAPDRRQPISTDEALAVIDELRERPTPDECRADGPVLTLNGRFPVDWRPVFADQTSAAIGTANVLNNIFRTWDSHPTSLYNEAFYYSLAKSFLADARVVGGTIAFDRDQYLFYLTSTSEQPTTGTFAPFVRVDADSPGVTRSLNLAQLTKDKYTVNGTRGYDWFWRQRKTFSDILWRQKDMCTEVDPRHVGASFDSVSSVTTTPTEGLWTDVYYDCARLDDWVVTYSVPFFGCNNFSQLFFKGVVAMDFAVRTIDINQCDTNRSNVFAETHRCRNTTQCIFTPGYGFRLGGYKCQCKPQHYFPPSSSNSKKSFFEGHMVEEAYQNKILNQSFGYDIGYQCHPCGRGCAPGCHNDTPCYVDYDVMIRGISVGVVSFCMSVCLILVIVIIRMRKTKVMKASMWIMMEIIILGTLLLYSTVIIQYFEPTDLMCILVPWFREVGFVIVYGAVVLKLYRILTEFQSRKAHRVDVRDKDLLKYIFTTVLIVVGFLSAWTAVNLDYMIEDGATMVTERRLPDNGLLFVLCREMWSEYIIELGEFLLLLYAIYLCYRTRSAPSDYQERRYLAIVIYNEAIVSTITHIIRHFLQGIIHPDYIFLMYFTRCQLTVSMLIILIIGPKLWYTHHPPDDDHFRNRAYSSSDVQDNALPESMKLHAGVNSNGDVDVAEINLSDMDPEEIRAELKRLYTQLQIYRTKTMRKDNPHISKRRGGRKQTHRRFSLQAFHHKHRHHHEHDHEHELSKTPEESTNSAEGVGYSIEESTCSVGELSERRTPTVTFKPGRKSFY